MTANSVYSIHLSSATSQHKVGRRSPIEVLNTLRRSPLFAQLHDQDIFRLNSRCLWRSVRAGELLVDGPVGYALSFVTSGRVRVVRMMNGREIILRDINEGDYFGELSATGSRSTLSQVVAITNAIIARMPSNVFREAICQYPSVCDQVVADLAERTKSLEDRFSERISLNARGRLCLELLRLARHTTEDRIAISPPPSHFEIAARIGGCRETVTKLLVALERDGLISRSRKAIALIDVHRLRSIAEYTCRCSARTKETGEETYS